MESKRVQTLQALEDFSRTHEGHWGYRGSSGKNECWEGCIDCGEQVVFRSDTRFS